MIFNALYYLLMVVVIYILYTRLAKPYYKWWYYRRQGIKFPSLPIPVFGDYLPIVLRIMKNPNRYPLFDYSREKLNS